LVVCESLFLLWAAVPLSIGVRETRAVTVAAISTATLCPAFACFCGCGCGRSLPERLSVSG
jgi:hypothetical protein